MLDMLRKHGIYLCGSEHDQLVNGGGVEEFLDDGPEEGEGGGGVAELFHLLVKGYKKGMCVDIREKKEGRTHHNTLNSLRITSLQNPTHLAAKIS